LTIGCRRLDIPSGGSSRIQEGGDMVTLAVIVALAISLAIGWLVVKNHDARKPE
jgi:hypothetical protein